MSRGPLRRLGKSISDAVNRLEVVRAMKYARSHVLDLWYRRHDRQAGLACAESLREHGCKHLAFAVAFNSPWVVDALVACWRRHVTGMELMIVDNSSDAAAREQHEAICRERGVRYLGLPPNPEWNPSRSHAFALNWIWSNIVRPAGLEMAGFVDHDLLAVHDIALDSRVAGMDAYGLRADSRLRPGRWNLWAGYCFLRPQAATGGIDFKPEHHAGVDTGGRNWNGMYRGLPADRHHAVTQDSESVRLEPGVDPIEIQRLDGAFLHLGGASYCDRFNQAGFRRKVMDAIWASALPGERRIAAVP
jgi:hypothetical protein